MPAVVFDLKYKEAGNIFLAAIHGRGASSIRPSSSTACADWLVALRLAFCSIEAGRSSDAVSIVLDNRGADTLVISFYLKFGLIFCAPERPAVAGACPGCWQCLVQSRVQTVDSRQSN